ncbi:MAG: hypothetical protein LUG98_05965 [Tannerellaceae bacterium]|nr:hypothetical protein [Tannerellaceae bacterium]
MDNLGDLLYIIVIAIAGIMGVFNSGKKKKRPEKVLRQPAAGENPEQVSGEKSFWEIFEELQQPEPASVPVPKPIPSRAGKKKENRATSTTQTVQEKKKQAALLSGDMSTFQFSTPQGSLLEEVPEDENYMFDDESFHNPDELRKAIIYTEILNRKY